MEENSTQVHVSDAANDFLVASNEHGRLLPQQLAENVPLAEDVDLDFGPVNIGGYEQDMLKIVVARQGVPEVGIFIPADQVLCLNPQKEPAFRGLALIEGVINPKISHWAKATE